MARQKDNLNRRSFLKESMRGLCLLTIGGTAGLVTLKKSKEKTVWQIDPDLCSQCGECTNYCVLNESAVKCVQSFPICGYCDLCTGYLVPEPTALDTGAENQLCPTGAINRTYIEDPYYEYTINEALCIGCAKCVKGCTVFGNGSLYLQVRHDRCLNCNECAIAVACPTDAFKRVPASNPYILRESIHA